MDHLDHFHIGQEVVGPLNLRGIITESDGVGNWRVRFENGVLQWLDTQFITRP